MYFFLWFGNPLALDNENLNVDFYFERKTSFDNSQKKTANINFIARSHFA